MKRLSKFIIALVLTLVAGFSVSACGKNEVTSAKVISGLNYSVVRNETIDTSNVKVMATYTKGGSKTFESSDLSFSTIDTSEIGEQKLTITIDPENFKFDVTINIVATEADVNTITQLESELLKEFNANRSIDSSTKEGFYDQNQPLRVGDDNPFNFRLKVSGIAADGKTLVEDIQSVSTVVKVELKIAENNYKELTADTEPAIETMVNVNSINAVLDFTNKAVDHEFRVTVTAKNPDEDYDLANYSFTADLTVIDGFNVYDTTDLSIFDNYNVEGNNNRDYYHSADIDGHNYGGSGWTPYHESVKSRYNMTDAQIKAVKTFIFQKDIDVTAENVRADAFWTGAQVNASSKSDNTSENMVGTPHNDDGIGIFQRSFEDGEQVSIIGNYFAINASTFPLMVVGSGDDGVNCDADGKGQGITSYLCLFRCEPKVKDGNTYNCNAGTKMTYDTLSFIGNAPVSEDVRKSGGLCLMKHRVMDLYGYNTTAKNFYITYYFDLGRPETNTDGGYDNGNFVVEKCKGYDSYQSLLYLYGARFTTIIDSDFRNAGGPAILIDCVENKVGSNKIYNVEGVKQMGPILNLVNSTFESKVSGSEAWFDEYNAKGYAGTISLYDNFLNGFFKDSDPMGQYTDTGKTIIADQVQQNGQDVNRLNIVAIIMRGGSSPIDNKDQLSGGVYMFDSLEDYYTQYGLNGRTASYTTNGLNLDSDIDKLAVEKGMPIIEDVAGGRFMAMPTGIPTDKNSLDAAGRYVGSAYISGQVLDGLYAGIYVKLDETTKAKIQGLFKQQLQNDSFTLPGIDGFKALTDKSMKLTIVTGIISAMSELYKGSDDAIAAGLGTLEQMYGEVSGYAPVAGWDKLTTVAEKASALVTALNRLVAKDKAAFTGNYVNLYLPSSYGCLGVVLGLYNQNKD